MNCRTRWRHFLVEVDGQDIQEGTSEVYHERDMLELDKKNSQPACSGTYSLTFSFYLGREKL